MTLSVATVFFLVGAAPVPGPVQVNLFCGAAPLRTCSDLVADLWPKTEQNVLAILDAFRAGKVLNPVAQEGESPFLAGNQIAMPTCDIGKTAAGCGTPCRFVCTRSAAKSSMNPKPWPSPSPAVSPVPRAVSSPVPPVITCNLESGPAVCSLERSWTRGALIALVNSKLQEVKAEVQSAGHAYSLGSRCQAVAGQLVATMNRFQSAKSLWDSYVNTGNRLPTCAKFAPGPEPSVLPGVEGTDPSATAQCLFLAAVPMLSSFAFQAALCEVFSRADLAWLATEAAKYPTHMTVNLVNAVGACAAPNPPFPGTLSECVNGQYAATIAGAFSKVSPVGQPVLVPPAGKWNACPLTNPIASPWEPILCTSSPTAPFLVAELGAMLQASESLSSVAETLDAAASLNSDAGTSVSPAGK